MDLQDLVLVPGRWLFELARLPPGYDEDEAAMVVSLGLAAWVVALLAGWALWRRAARRFAGAGRVEVPRIPPDQVEALSGQATRAWERLRSLRWRRLLGGLAVMQGVHLVLFVVPTLAIALVKLLFAILLVPLTIMSFADQHQGWPRIEPLDRPACWTFVSWCPSPLASYRRPDEHARTACAADERCRDTRIAAHDPAQPFFKLAWLLVVIGLIGWGARASRLKSRSRP